MTESKELRIPSSDLAVICIRCKHCKAELAVDLRRQEQRRVLDELNKFECPVCRTGFDSALRRALKSFDGWLSEIQQSGEDVSFRLPLEDKNPAQA